MTGGFDRLSHLVEQPAHPGGFDRLSHLAVRLTCLETEVPEPVEGTGTRA
ncbi:hypothetical protein QE430_002270 [Microbacterium testaceum]|nr:hypothetical protein [Microbacterium testaceum]